MERFALIDTLDGAADQQTEPRVFDMSEIRQGPQAELPTIEEASAPEQEQPLSPLGQMAINTLHKGDVIDRVVALKRRSVTSRSIQAQMLTTLTTVAVAGSPGGAAASILTAIAGSGLPYAKDALHRYARRKTYHALRGQISQTQQHANLPIELFRQGDTKNHSLHIRLYDYSKEQSREKLLYTVNKLQQVVNETDAKAVTMPHWLVDGLLDNDQASSVQTPAEWLSGLNKHSKRKPLDKKFDKSTAQNEKLVTLNPDQLRRVLDRLESEQGSTSLEASLAWIRKVMPSHPAVRVYDRLRLAPNVGELGMYKSLSNVFSDCIERRLGYAGSEMVELVHGNGRVHRQKYYLQPRLRLDTQTDEPVVDWRRPGRTVVDETTSLLAEYNVNPDKLQRLLAHPDKLPANQLTEICELVAWLYLEGHDSVRLSYDLPLSNVTMPSTTQDVAVIGTQARLLQSRLAPKISERSAANMQQRPLYRKSRVMTLLLAASIIAVPEGIKEANSYSADVINSIETASPQGQPLLAERYFAEGWSAARSAIRDYLYKPVDGVAGTLFATMTNSKDTLVVSEGSASGLSIGYGAVGNLSEVGVNRPVWEIRAKGGMSSEGYWSSEVYDRLRLNDKEGMYWHGSNFSHQADDPNSVARISSAPPNNSQYLEVSPTDLGDWLIQTGMKGSTLLYYIGSETPKELIDPEAHYALLDVPVLRGTRIAAAAVDNAKEQLVLSDDQGRQRIVVKEQPDKLVNLEKYWLVTDANAPSPVRRGALDIDQNPGSDQRAILDIWERSVGELEADNKDRLMQMQSWVTSNFEYSLAPLESQDALKNIRHYSEYVLRLQEANCNIAATLLTLANQDLIAPVGGYYNTNTPKQTRNGVEFLSSLESHMWTVDSGGTIYDATPSSDDQELARFFAEDYGPGFLANPYTQGGAALGAAALMVLNRRRLARIGFNSRVRLARSTARMALAITSDTRIQRASSGLQYANYAANRELYVRSGQPVSMLSLKGVDPTESARMSLQDWTRSFGQERPSLKSRNNIVNRELRRDTKSAVRIARNMQRANRQLRKK